MPKNLQLNLRLEPGTAAYIRAHAAAHSLQLHELVERMAWLYREIELGRLVVHRPEKLTQPNQLEMAGSQITAGRLPVSKGGASVGSSVAGVAVTTHGV